MKTITRFDRQQIDKKESIIIDRRQLRYLTYTKTCMDGYILAS